MSYQGADVSLPSKRNAVISHRQLVLKQNNKLISNTLFFTIYVLWLHTVGAKLAFYDTMLKVLYFVDTYFLQVRYLRILETMLIGVGIIVSANCLLF